MNSHDYQWLRLPLYLLMLFFLADNIVFSQNGLIEKNTFEAKKAKLRIQNAELAREIKQLQSELTYPTQSRLSDGISIRFVEVSEQSNGEMTKLNEDAKLSERQWYLFSTTVILMAVILISYLRRSKHIMNNY